MNLKPIFIGGLTLLFLVGCASAASAPTLPAMLYGTVTDENGNPLPAGTVITAELNGETFTYTLNEAGKIGGDSTFDDKFIIEPSTAVGNTEITLSINGKTASQKVPYTSGKASGVNLVFPISSEIPILEPTKVQTTKPTQKPTMKPTEVQTTKPTQKPTVNPTEVQTTNPTAHQTQSVAEQPTATATAPTQNPVSAIGILAGLLSAAVLLRRN